MSVLRRSAFALAAALIAAAVPGVREARAEAPLVLVELFSSQGCSSCPPADALMQDIAQMDGVVGLSLHVDYWDYIGWKDSFAKPAFTKRQKGYAHAAGSRMIYTPQMIIAGEDHVVGTRPMEVTNAIMRHQKSVASVSLRVTRAGERVQIHAAPQDGSAGELVIFLARYIPEETVAITRGENSGRTVTYSNVVTAMDEVARWPGSAPLDIELEISGPQPGVVIVQEARSGPVRAVAHVP